MVFPALHKTLDDFIIFVFLDMSHSVLVKTFNQNWYINKHCLYVRFFVFSLVISVVSKTQPESKCPELLANYCDMLLRRTPLSKKLTSEEIETKLKNVVSCHMIVCQIDRVVEML